MASYGAVRNGIVTTAGESFRGASVAIATTDWPTDMFSQRPEARSPGQGASGVGSFGDV